MNIFDKNSKDVFYSFDSFFSYFTKNLTEDFLVFSDFIRSSFVDIFSNGLSFQIYDEQESLTDFLTDRYFSNYHNICMKYNFNIDKYNPWIIVRKIDGQFISNNSNKYIDVYTLDVIITFEAIRKAFVYYKSRYTETEHYSFIDVDSLELPKNSFYHFYVNCKLKFNKIQLGEKQVNELVQFFIKNAIKNTIKDSVFKIGNITKKHNSISKNWK